MNKLTFTIQLISLAGMLTLSATTRAGCTSSTGTDQKSFSPSTISVSRTAAVGTVISESKNISGSSTTVTCTSGQALYTMLRYGNTMTLSNYANGVYDTGVPGIGVKVWMTWTANSGNYPVLNNDFQRWYYQGTSWNGNNYITGMQMQLIVTGPVSTGTIKFPTSFVEAWMGTSLSSSGATRYNVINMNNVTINALSCETPDITVNLDKHDSNEFSGINSKSAAKVFNFEIKNCNPGMNSVNYTFAPAAGVTLQQAGNANQYITLDASSTASGVGIQVLYNDGSIVPFNSKIKYTGYSTSTGGSYTIPMKARYIQTASNISGGTANSAVEFTMSYE